MNAVHFAGQSRLDHPLVAWSAELRSVVVELGDNATLYLDPGTAERVAGSLRAAVENAATERGSS